MRNIGHQHSQRNIEGERKECIAHERRRCRLVKLGTAIGSILQLLLAGCARDLVV